MGMVSSNYHHLGNPHVPWNAVCCPVVAEVKVADSLQEEEGPAWSQSISSCHSFHWSRAREKWHELNGQRYYRWWFSHLNICHVHMFLDSYMIIINIFIYSDIHIDDYICIFSWGFLLLPVPLCVVDIFRWIETTTSHWYLFSKSVSLSSTTMAQRFKMVGCVFFLVECCLFMWMKLLGKRYCSIKATKGKNINML